MKCVMKVIRSHIARMRTVLPQPLDADDYIGNDQFAVYKLQPSVMGAGAEFPVMRPEFHTICVLESGSGVLHAGATTFPLYPSGVAWVKPDVYLSAVFTPEAQGYLLFFSPLFLQEIGYACMFGCRLPPAHNALAFSFSQAGFGEVTAICRAFFTDWQRYPLYRHALSGNSLAGLLLLMMETGGSSFWQTRLLQGKGQRLLEAFLLLLDDHFSRLAAALTDEMLRTRDYAALLHVCPSYLSKTIRQYSGRSIREWKQRKILDDAVYLLRHTRMSISDISDRYCFSECSYFHAFFKKYMASTPGSFRRRESPHPTGTQVAMEDHAATVSKMEGSLTYQGKLANYLVANNLVRILLIAAGNGTKEAPQLAGTYGMLAGFRRDLDAHLARLMQGAEHVRYNVRDFARLQRVHENYFSSMISQASGKRPHLWIAEGCCWIAMELLRDFNLSVKEISHRLRFRYVSHFCSFFKKYAGLTPKAYRAGLGLRDTG